MRELKIISIKIKLKIYYIIGIYLNALFDKNFYIQIF